MGSVKGTAEHNGLMIAVALAGWWESRSKEAQYLRLGRICPFPKDRQG